MKKLLFILTMLTASLAANAGEFKTVFIYGLAMSFNDSTVYLTDIQRIDSVWIEKNGFLYSRENYSYQLRDFMRSKGKNDITPVTFFAEKQKDIEKKFIKTRKKLNSQKMGYTVNYIAVNEFHFERIMPSEQDINKDSGTLKEERKKAKEAKKAQKKANKDMKKGIRPDIENIPQT